MLGLIGSRNSVDKRTVIENYDLVVCILLGAVRYTLTCF